jgi:hypothetical protein
MAKSDLWMTPPDLMTVLHKEFDFTMEVCADDDRRAIPSIPYMGLDNDRDALVHMWFRDTDGTDVNYCNPPYSLLPEFVTAADQNSSVGTYNIMLIPAYTDTKYWQDIIFKRALQIRFLKGRLRFWENGKPGKDTARFPSALVIFGGPEWTRPEIIQWDWKASAKP